MYDVVHKHIVGYRLPAPGAANYASIVPQGGRYPSDVLQLDLYLASGKLTFSAQHADLPNADQLISKLEQLMDEGERRSTELEVRLEEEQKRHEAAEAELSQLRATLAELQRSRQR